jgi:hypothetical protein
MPIPEGHLIPVYMTELDWATLLKLLDQASPRKNGYASIIADNIERQVRWSGEGPVK